MIYIPRVVLWPERFGRRPYPIRKGAKHYGPHCLVTDAGDGSVGMIIFWVRPHHTGIYMKDYSDE